MVRAKLRIRRIGTYRPPWDGLKRDEFIRLDLNENTRPPTAAMRTALSEFLSGTAAGIYPTDTELLPLLATYAATSPEQLLVTNGSDQALELILRMFLDPGDSLLVAQPEFPMISHIAGVIGARVLGVPFGAALEFPTAAFEEAAKAAPDLIVFINPNNPTGTPVELESISRLLRAYPETPVLVDEAYFEYTGQSASHLLHCHPNLLVTRTFSKAFAMAGLRLGYIIARQELISELRKVRGPFDVNACAITAAMAQLRNLEPVREQVSELLQQTKPRVLAYLQEREIKHHPSPANFLLVWPGDVDRCVHYLKDRRILVRKMSAQALQGAFRMSLGTAQEMEHFINVFNDYIEGQ